MLDRVHAFEGIHNFRDYGGYRAGEGTIRRRILYRSGQHAGATPDDLTRFAEFGVATVIDLRGDSERREMPCLRHDTFAGDVLFAQGETVGHELAPHEEAGRGIATADEARAAMSAIYVGMPYRPVLVATLRLYFEALATRDGATLLHCLAGKDRTGFTVALLHTMLGVHPDDVMADYLLTNIAGNQARRIGSAAPAIRARYGAALTDDAIAALMGVEAHYLEIALAAVRERHGDVGRYAEEVLGIDAAMREKLAARLIE